MNLVALRAAGIAGIVGAICWAIGDVLLVGGSAPAEQFPLLLRDYADRIPFKALAWMLPFDEPRLAAGAMIANLSIPLYLAGSWHLYQGVKPAGGTLPFAAFALLFCANAWSPLGHASFYYPGMVYKTIPALPVTAHPALLTLGAQFSHNAGCRMVPGSDPAGARHAAAVRDDPCPPDPLSPLVGGGAQSRCAAAARCHGRGVTDTGRAMVLRRCPQCRVLHRLWAFHDPALEWRQDRRTVRKGNRRGWPRNDDGAVLRSKAPQQRSARPQCPGSLSSISPR